MLRRVVVQTPSCRHACQRWVHHLGEAQPDGTAIVAFSRKHRLHWLEAMSLLGRVAQAIHTIVAVQDMLQVGVNIILWVEC